MHKWWARRLGSVFRTILLYSLLDDDITDWDGNFNSLWDLYSRDIRLSGKIVMDPMMGGGTTVVEALRLGCKTIAADLNPVAWYIVKKEIESIDSKCLKKALIDLEMDLGEELSRYYKTTCPDCGSDAEGIYYFFCKELECDDCGSKISLMRDFFLSKSPSGNGDCVICPNCWSVFETKDANRQTQCTTCGFAFVPKRTSFASKHEYHCSSGTCSPGKIVDSIKANGRPKERMYAIEFYCQKCDRHRNPRLKNGRGYKASDKRDIDLFEKAKKEYDHIKGKLPIPETEIPLGVETKRALNHGYRQFKDMFNQRQLLNLGKIYLWILNVDEWDLKEFLVLAFSNCLKYNNMFCKYNSTRGFITDIFRTHSYSPSMAPVEANCYDTPKGRGAFTAFVNLVIEGKEYCRRPFERVPNGEKLTKIQFGPSIVGKLAAAYEDLLADKNALLLCQSSDNLPIPNASVDAVITDPPYYGNVMYSELSNFFYVWLKIALESQYDHFRSEVVPWKMEVIENRVQKKGKKEFLDGLTKVFSEARRVLKDNGLLVFTFHHKSIDAWSLILQAVLESGFFISAAYPVRSEMKASTHLYLMNNIKYDMILVCRKRIAHMSPRKWSEIKKEIKRNSKETIQNLRKNGEKLHILDMFAMILGKSLEQYSKYYPEIYDSGRRIDMTEALTSIEKSAKKLASELA